MRLVFLGTPPAAVPSLRSLLDAGHEVGLVVCQPDRPARRSRRPQPPAVKQAAVELGLEVFQPTRVKNEAFVQRLAAVEAQALAVVAYGRILTRRVLDLVPLGAINLHFSLLPRYRGAAPVQWALARGERVTGVSTMLINEQLDEGDVLQQRELSIAPGEHAPALAERLAAEGAGLLTETLRKLAAEELIPRPQDAALATFAPLLTVADGRYDPALKATEIEGRIRGFDPWPGVWARCCGRRMRLVDGCALEGTVDAPVGTLVEQAPEGVVLACAGGTRLALAAVQPEGRRAVGAADALNGRQLRLGERLEPPADEN